MQRVIWALPFISSSWFHRDEAKLQPVPHSAQEGATTHWQHRYLSEACTVGTASPRTAKACSGNARGGRKSSSLLVSQVPPAQPPRRAEGHLEFSPRGPPAHPQIATQCTSASFAQLQSWLHGKRLKFYTICWCLDIHNYMCCMYICSACMCIYDMYGSPPH